MSKYLELVEGSFNESHFNKQTSQNPYVAYSIQDDRVIYTKIPNYLCLEPIDSNNQLALAKIGDYSNIQYSFDKKNWNDFTTDPTNPLNLTYISVDKPIYLRGNNPNGIFNEKLSVGCKLIGSGKYNVSGDVTTLLNEVGDVKDLTPYGKQTLALLFGVIYGKDSGLPIDIPCVDIVDASKLILPSIILSDYCYKDMFWNCTSLTTAPAILPATTLAEGCYRGMFSGCTSLTTAPELPATELATSCYQAMFLDCTSLTAAPEILPATTLAKDCYYYMFSGCTSLTTAPDILPATTLAERCYYGMFDNCTSLAVVPELPATTLAEGCYRGMFQGCTSLTTAPVLPATELARDCYHMMFYGCSSLTTVPMLPATTLAERCYMQMFEGCTNLDYIKCLATDISATNCTNTWFAEVASTGTFVKHPDMNEWRRDVHGIPMDWKVEDAVL